MKIFKYVIVISILLFSCKKDKEEFTNNEVPPYDGISTLQVENYVNRLFIDLVGREPLDTEMELEVDILEIASLSSASRNSLVHKLQSDTNSLPGDSSYFIAYNRKVLEDTKARLLEGSSDAEVEQEFNLFEGFATADSINGNLVGYELNKAISRRLKLLLQAQYSYRINEISIQNVYQIMLNTSIYDQINMNSANFINASFDNLFYRFPTQSEFDQAFPIIENNEAGQLFGVAVLNKDDYINLLTANQEFKEGLIRWAFLSLLSREPNTNESFDLINQFTSDNSLLEIQKRILITDEYAGF